MPYPRVPPSLLLLAALRVCAGAQAQEAELTLGLASHIVVRGIALPGGKPSIQATASYYDTRGWLASLGAASLRTSDNQTSNLQVFGKLGYAYALSPDWSAQVELSRYDYPRDAEGRPYRRDEITGTAAYRDLASLSVTAQRVPSRYPDGARTSTAVDMVGRYPLPHGLAAEAGLGHHDLQRRLGFSYRYGHLGVSGRRGASSASLVFIMNDHTAKTRFGDYADNRWVATLTRSF